MADRRPPTLRGRRLAVGGLLAAALVAAALVAMALTKGGSGTLQALGPPHFVEEASAAGVQHTVAGGYATYVGGGVAVFDCDGDGRPDLYVAGGADPSALYRNDSPIGGALRFTPLHDPVTDLTGVNGAYPIDIDGDGIVDLAVLRIGGATLLRGLGGCRFAAADTAWAFDGGHGDATAFSATWEGADRWPTVAVGNYLTLDASGQPTFDCDSNALYRPAAGVNAFAAPITLAPGYCALSMLFSDWQRTGQRDLRISNDAQYYDPNVGEEQLWRVVPPAAPHLYTADEGWLRYQLEGMGIAAHDVNGDGMPDVFLTSQGASRLQTVASGPGYPTYEDIGLARGVNSAHPFTGDTSLPSTAWHPEFQDVNNDGLIDLFISKGNVSSMPDYALADASDLFIGQPDGTFVEGAGQAGIVSLDRGRGAAMADFNLDGLLDIVLVNHGAPVRLWRNVGAGTAAAPAPMGHWLAVDLEEPGGNHDAIGAWLDVRAGGQDQQREIVIGGGHASGELGWIHVGLGAADSAQVRVEWPDGTQGPWQTVRADTFVRIDRSVATPVVWTPGS